MPFYVPASSSLFFTPTSFRFDSVFRMKSAVVFAAVLTGFLVGFTGAQQPSPPANPYSSFTPSMGVIIIVLIGTIFLMGFFSIYIRHCYDGSPPVGGFRRGFSIRARRTGAARGLNTEIIETFPIISYSEVKDHKIGKGALECAVCLNEFAEEDTLRLLPKCDHVFHPDCIGAWLEQHVTCPVCRANLEQQQADTPTVLTAGEVIDSVDRSGSRRAEIAIQIDESQFQETPATEIPSQSPPPPPPARSWSLRKPDVFGFARFKSHSTGHSLVFPGENLDRFTLRLPEGVRKEVIDRAILNRSGEGGSSIRVYRTSGEGSSRAGRYIRKIEKSDARAKSDRWAIFARALSGKLTKAVADGGEGSGAVGGRTPVKMPSFNCFEPKTEDGAGLIANDAARKPV